MKPVAIFRHSPTEGPGYFATFLEAHGIPWRLIAIDAAMPVPADAREFSGLALMGGPMSVNDPLPWVAEVCELIRSATEARIPVIGHCLGGQLISKALGGRIARNPVKEIGWGPIALAEDDTARGWLGPLAGLRALDVFHWHGETFSIPAGATRIAGSAHCENQIFVHGVHLAMQCHVEMAPAMIRTWCDAWHDEVRYLAEIGPGVQTPEAMVAEIAAKLPAMRRLADQLYGVWIGGLRRG